MTVLMRRLAVAAGLTAGLACGVPALTMQALAGGDDYDATSEPVDAGPSYFGFVRDARGSPVSDARVILRPKSGDGVEVKTNVLGLYRTHVNKDADPVSVEISCDKDGYRQTRVLRRTPPSAGARVIETDCTLQRL